MVRVYILAAAIALWSWSAQAQEDREIVVTGERLREATMEFAAAIASASIAEGQYARWDNDICPSVAGLAQAEAQTLIDHLAVRANQVGMSVEGAGCQPNLVIVFAPDSDRFAREVVDRRRDLLGYYSEDDVITLGRDALEAFAMTPRAVRWWHVSNTTTADGRSLADTRSNDGSGTRGAALAVRGDIAGAATAGSGYEGAEATRSRGTRLSRETRQDLRFALVIVDTRRIAGMPSGAVADYLAMASFIQLDANADMSGFPSILNLFSARQPGEAPPNAMTDWDVAYLRGLYNARRDADAMRQRGDIARRMANDLDPN
jgi:hypothetical protein